MARFPAEEISACYERATRRRVEGGEQGWDVLAAFFTDDASWKPPAGFNAPPRHPRR